jgi:hypothetical protein
MIREFLEDHYHYFIWILLAAHLSLAALGSLFVYQHSHIVMGILFLVMASLITSVIISIIFSIFNGMHKFTAMAANEVPRLEDLLDDPTYVKMFANILSNITKDL